MILRLKYWREILLGSFWLLPTALLLAILGLLVFLLNSRPDLSHPFWKFLAGVTPRTSEGSRQILAAIAGATMTVIGVVFSVVMLVLQQAANQYSPRLLQSFLKEPASQVVLGIYAGTFLYCLALLQLLPSGERDITGGTHGAAVTLGVILAMTSLALLIFYVHHVAESIRLETILDHVRRETLSAVEDYQDLHQKAAETIEEPQVFEHEEPWILRSPETGFIQDIEWQDVEQALPRHPWRAKFLIQAGEFVQTGAPLLAVVGLRDAPSPRVRRKLMRVFAIGQNRTISQDPRYGLQQLTDIALRGLSPAINDPRTALEALWQIEAILFEMIRLPGEGIRQCLGGGRELQIPLPKSAELLGTYVSPILAVSRPFPAIVGSAHRMCTRLAESALDRPDVIDAIESFRRELTDAATANLEARPSAA